MKKAISILMCVALLLGMMPMTVFATEIGDSDGVAGIITEDSQWTEYQNIDNLTVNNGIRLTQNCIVDVKNVTVNGTIYIQAPASGNPNGLNIESGGWLKVSEGGSVIADEGQILEIRSGATVEGITLYDGDSEYKGGFENTEIFSYHIDETTQKGRWIRQVSGGSEPGVGIPDNKYVVRFDPRGNAEVKVNDVSLVSDERITYDFQKNNTLSIALTKPNDVESETNPIVYIRKNNGEINISDTLTYTPSDDEGFEIIVYWTQVEHDYDRFGPGNGQIMLEFGYQGEGIVEVVDPNIEKKTCFNWTKVVVASGTKKIGLRVVPNLNNEFIDIVKDFNEANRLSKETLISQSLFNDATSVYTMTPDNREDGYYRLEFFFTGADGGGDNGNENQYNFTRLQEELNATYFAFGNIDGDEDVDSEDLKYGVMRTLYDGFRVNEGRYQQEGAALGLIEDFDKENPENSKLTTNMNKLLSLALVESTKIDTIPATDKNGVEHSFDSYNVKITIDKLYENRSDFSSDPVEESATDLGKNPIVLTAKAYLINMDNSSEQVIIKVNDKYFVRDAYSDRDNNNTDDLESFQGLNANALIIVSDFNTKKDIHLFGNFAATSNEAFSNETSQGYYAAGFGTNGEMKYLGDKFVVFKPSFLGVTINGTGENKSPLAWSVESSLSIADTSSGAKDAETDIYFGFNTVEISPITGKVSEEGKVSGLRVTGIDSVKVLDGIPENALKIEMTENNDTYKIHFLSDYYDTVRIQVNYKLDGDNTASGIMKLNRVGIMIQGGMTAGDSHNIQIMHGHDSGRVLDKEVYEDYKEKNAIDNGEYKFAFYATYYYPTNSQAEDADVSLFVTYTYEGGRVERKLLETSYFTPATEDNVAMSDYILYMGDGTTNAPIKVETIAVPNANADGTISGAKLGAGKGVEKIFDFSD